MFLQRLAIHTAERRRITDWPLLVLRAAAVAVLVLAFARPVFRVATAAATDASSRTVVIALDRSLSMAHQAAWPAAVDSVGESGRLGVTIEPRWCCSMTMPIAQDITQDRATLLAALATARPGSRGTRYASALRAARQLLDAAGSATGELYVVSDLQRSGATGVAGMSLRRGMTVHAVAVTQPPVNLPIATVTAERIRVKDGHHRDRAQLVARGVTAPRTITIALTADGRATGRVRPPSPATVRRRFGSNRSRFRRVMSASSLPRPPTRWPPTTRSGQ